MRAEAPAAPIYSFVPAGGSESARGESRRAVRQLLEAIGARLLEARADRSDLLADFLGSQVRPGSSIVCKDLSEAEPAEAAETIQASEGVFLVSATDPDSVSDACAQAAWLRYAMHSLKHDDACGLLLVPTPGGIPEVDAEQQIGLPLCGVLRNAEHTAQLARMIAQD